MQLYRLDSNASVSLSLASAFQLRSFEKERKNAPNPLKKPHNNIDLICGIQVQPEKQPYCQPYPKPKWLLFL